MKRTLGMLVAVGSILSAGAAHAALPPTPGVAFINNGIAYPPYGPYAFYSGGPVTGNHLVVEVSPDRRAVTFDEPTTVMAPGPAGTAALAVWEINNETALLGRNYDAPEQNCTYGVGHATCPGTPEYIAMCDIRVTTGLGFDTITIRNGPVAGGVCGVQIASGRGNDTIDARDGAPTSIDCGGAFDRVRADAGDFVSSDCEVVTRG